MKVRWWIGLYDRDGKRLHLGDRVRYNLEGRHTKREYWNPEYIIIWDAPCFRLKHVGGGKPGDNAAFILRYGGTNGDLELLGEAK